MRIIYYDILKEVIIMEIRYTPDGHPYPTGSRTRTPVPDLDLFTMHTHEHYELFCFVAGDADYFVEGTVYSLSPGDILLLKKSEAHALLVNSQIPYERIISHFTLDNILGDPEDKAFLCDFLNNRPLGKNQFYPAARFKDTNWAYYLKRMHSTRDLYQRCLYLTILLNELRDAYPKICQDAPARKDALIDIIAYINENLTTPLTLDTISDKFFISKAQLNRKFKKITGSTVWEYITTKRLLRARELLQNGEAPTAVCAQSGFNDYCSFYRAYKNKFGTSPRSDRPRP